LNPVYAQPVMHSRTVKALAFTLFDDPWGV